jgi:predicted Rossmann fold flavoprotein
MSAVIAIIGAGAAGLMAAIHAATPGVRVVLIERLSDGGRKILISGGGRCNVLPAALDERRFVTASSTNSMRKILRAWPLAEMREFFERDASLPLVVEEETGKLFPLANTSRSVRDALQRLADQRGVEWRTRSLVKSLAPLPTGNWQIGLDDGTTLDADAVVIATGGLSVPSTGSDGFAFRTLAALGHMVHPTYPALTPLTLDPPAFADLAGVSLDVLVRAESSTERREAQGGFLFTHRGYSGPSLLDVSHVAVRGRLAGEPRAQLQVCWSTIDGAGWRQRLAPGAGQVGTVLRRELPARLADRLLHEAEVSGDTALSRFERAARERLVTALTAFPLPWTSDEGYKKAEVTGGGVALEEVQPTTLESRIHKGLFLAGELLDAFGPIGGYNFTWAWVTGRQAGLGAVRYVLSEKREARGEK